MKHCPFCGKTDSVEIDNGEEEPVNPRFFRVICNFRNGGCGASSGFYIGEVKALERWEMRAPNKSGL